MMENRFRLVGMISTCFKTILIPMDILMLTGTMPYLINTVTRPIQTLIYPAVPTSLNISYRAGYWQQNGLVKNFPDPVAAINNNYDFQRYNFRSNLDLKANKTLDLRLDVTTRFSDTNSPNKSAASTLSDVYNFAQETPFTAPFLNRMAAMLTLFAIQPRPFANVECQTCHRRLPGRKTNRL